MNLGENPEMQSQLRII
jgi:hypothetical protein